MTNRVTKNKINGTLGGLTPLEKEVYSLLKKSKNYKK